MEKEEIEEGNKLISDFDGNFYSFAKNLMYHKKWDWLMPVCKKFDNLYRDGKKELLDNMEYMMHCDNIDDSVTCYEIKPAFKALVEAIKWYKIYMPCRTRNFNYLKPTNHETK